MKYTDSQLLAIKEENKNILVSAGAGSGKTGVLKARVLNKLKNGVHIDELIILTFTKAAASEMKSRIVEAINQDDSLKSELSRMNHAIITTFDAFCLKLVKEYHYLLGLPANITIANKLQFLDMQQKVLEETIKSYYLANDEAFDSMVLDYFQKGDDLIKSSVSNLANKVSKYPNPIQRLDRFEKDYLTNEIIHSHFEEFEKKIYQLVDLAHQKYADLSAHLSNTSIDSIDRYITQIGAYINNLKNKDLIYDILQNTAFPRKPVLKKDNEYKEMFDDYYNQLKPILDELKGVVKDLNLHSKEEAINRVISTKKNTLKIVDITKEYLTRLNFTKKELNLYSYQDISDLAINLLENNDDIANLYKTKINEIMIDEYQDTNDLQVYFIGLIANNNLFMVGDIKQSIYGFRDANPKNFLEKYLSYEKNDGGMLITLRENFRSRRHILEDINQTFYQTMDEYIGGINYQDNQSLVYGLKAYDQVYENQHYGIELHTYDLETLKETDDTLTSTIVEAQLLAKDISNKINQNYQILDQTFRTIKYSDIVVLVDRKTNFQTISKVLSSQNIPVNLYSDEPFASSIEMLFLFNFLRLLYCFKSDDYLSKNFASAFYSVCRSFVFKIKDQEIIHCLNTFPFKTKQDLFVLDSFVTFSGLLQLCVELVNKIDDLPLEKMILLIYHKLDIYKEISYLDNPGMKEEKLDFFKTLVDSFENFDFHDLIVYIDQIKENPELDIEFSKVTNEIDAITIMTMHKSKGLQYPMVYCLGLNKLFNYTENKDFFIFDLEYGYIANAFDHGYTHTFLRYLSLDKTKRDYISERIRLLYVAFTRAKENLILFGDVANFPEDKDILTNHYIDNRIRLKYRRFTDLLASTAIKDYTVKNQLEDIIANEVTNQLDESKFQTVEKASFDFSKSKMQDITYSKSELSLFNDETIKAIEYGNYVHKQLEDFDFKHIEESLNNLPEKLKSSYKTLLASSVFNFDKEMKVMQEYEFVQDNSIGIIDLLIEYDDQFIILDYKLKNIEDSAYKKQLNAYKDYIETISKKTVTCYLYSILDETLVKVL